MDLAQFADVLLGSSNPRDAAERTLRWLKDEYGARAVALWQSNGDGLILELSLGLDHESLGGAQELWARDPAGLLDGQPVVDGNRVLIPTRPKGSYLYLDGVDTRRLNLTIAADGATVALNALHRKASNVQGRPFGSDDLRREELIATLQLHEWNLARVARVRGVSRKTIYDWLAKYNIPRDKVRKS